MKVKIDQTDCKIIELLQQDGRMPNTMIAKKLGISEATVRSRLNRLTKEEYIQIVAVSNPLKLGTGSSEIYAEFNAKSIDDLNDFVSQKVNKIDGLLKTETSLVLKYIKRRYDWKTAIG